MSDLENTYEPIVLDALPDYIEEDLAERARLQRAMRADHAGFEFVVSDVDAWAVGQTLRVAFLGGHAELYEKIEGALQDITTVCNIHFDMKDGNKYRTWSEADNGYAAEIRVSFDLPGYFSLVGRDSIDRRVGSNGGPVGGNPWQRSLNLKDFDRRLPGTWQGTVLHEFLHALGFHHEHQNLEGPCQQEFRWEDDPGYQPTTDARQMFIPDPQRRRPGIYTYLQGYPNFWDRVKVDHNLRADPAAALRYGKFDRNSVMLYRFPELFYSSPNSQCRPGGDGQRLSPGDIAGLQLLYPSEAQELLRVVTRRLQLAERLMATHSAVQRMARGDEVPPVGFARWISRVKAGVQRLD
jgi:hypothetical protein